MPISAMPRPPAKTVALAMQHEAIGSLLAHYFEKSAGLRVLWSAGSSEETLQLCAQRPPNLLILSPSFRGVLAADLARQVRSKSPDTKILLFAGALHQEQMRQMVEARVHGIVAASSPLATLHTAVSAVLGGACFFDRTAEAHLHSRRRVTPPLSKRETEVLALVASGLSTKEVANELGICVKTAEKFRERIMKKLQLHDVVRLTRHAILTGVSALEHEGF